MEEITREDVCYMKRTMMNYYYLKSEEQKYLRESMELQFVLEQEMKGSGMSFEDNSNGCSTGYPTTPYENQLIHEIRGYDLEAAQCKRKYMSLDKLNKIENRFKKLSTDQQTLIYAILRKSENICVVAGREHVSRQAITDRLDNAIERMLKMEV